ncbi:hypothetical protein JB92DRAFT_3091980 [Gautieria morchelliformis]|nr:hypothetical protein JB92DRAFT_3091980 [Gautieria morchelliformis]
MSSKFPINNLTPGSEYSSQWLYDHILTLELEVHVFWPAPWSMIKVLYLLRAYPGFRRMWIVRGLLEHHTWGVASSPLICSRVYKVRVLLLVGGMAVAELVLVRRTWAIFGTLGISVGVFWAVIVAWLLSSRPAPEAMNCILLALPTFGGVDFILLVIAESVILGLTLYNARVHLLGVRLRPTVGGWSSSTLATPLYRNAISVANIAIVVILVSVWILEARMPLPADSWTRIILLILVQRMLHAILIKRILLNLRVASSEDYGPTVIVCRLLCSLILTRNKHRVLYRPQLVDRIPIYNPSRRAAIAGYSAIGCLWPFHYGLVRLIKVSGFVWYFEDDERLAMT